MRAAPKALRLQLIWWHRTLEGPRPGRSGFRRFTQRVADVPVDRWFRNCPVAAIEPVRRDALCLAGQQVDLREVAPPHELRELPPQQLVRRERVVHEQLFRRTRRRPRCCTSTTLVWRCGEKRAHIRASSARPPSAATTHDRACAARRHPSAAPAPVLEQARDGIRQRAGVSERQAGAAVFNHLGSPPTAVTTTGLSVRVCDRYNAALRRFDVRQDHDRGFREELPALLDRDELVDYDEARWILHESW